MSAPVGSDDPRALSQADRDAIANVLATWALGYDSRDVGAMSRCFTDDAVMTLHIGPQTMGPYVGHAAVLAHFTDHHAIQTDQRRHVTTNLVVEEAPGGRARSISYLTLIVVDGGALRVQATGVYRDELERDVSGTWKIATRVLDLDVHY